MSTTPNIETRSLLNVIGDNNPDGCTVGQSSTTKAGFHGAAVVQAAAITAVASTGATNSTPYGFTTAAQADALVTAVNALITACKNKGILAAS